MVWLTNCPLDFLGNTSGARDAVSGTLPRSPLEFTDTDTALPARVSSDRLRPALGFAGRDVFFDGAAGEDGVFAGADAVACWRGEE